jgi:NADH-quinone oxidoreductase subunit B
MEVLSAGGLRYDPARFGMEKVSNTPRQADLMIVSGRVSQKMAPVLRQVYDPDVGTEVGSALGGRRL